MFLREGPSKIQIYKAISPQHLKSGGWLRNEKFTANPLKDATLPKEEWRL